MRILLLLLFLAACTQVPQSPSLANNVIDTKEEVIEGSTVIISTFEQPISFNVLQTLALSSDQWEAEIIEEPEVMYKLTSKLDSAIQKALWYNNATMVQVEGNQIFIDQRAITELLERYPSTVVPN